MENKSREGQYVRNKAHKIMHGIMVFNEKYSSRSVKWHNILYD